VAEEKQLTLVNNAVGEGFAVHRKRFLGNIRRFARAVLVQALPTQRSYAHDEEDDLVRTLTQELEIAGTIYIDVGANDPIHGSNTYLFYRLGLDGVCIDPNPEMAVLYDMVRPRDMFVVAACSDDWGYRRLAGISPATSSLVRNSDGKYGCWVCAAPLDAIVGWVEPRKIFLLSVDTEGNELNVLRGAQKVLARTAYVICESVGAESDRTITSFLNEQGFDLIQRIGLNLLFYKAGILAVRRPNHPRQSRRLNQWGG